ncbi:NAD(P)-binding protein [Methylophaga sp.]|uniref:NAD(P)/FAD-dependent oxidoreductase n=1 Tax=Methylophaga sp. TaxID=2024840 RepID=UPI0013FF6B82|nr:NAD(P)-binding protein [Methylophaga sp.]MTI63417.1 hypothetical protein [Methylophaga sp.]
MKSIAIVGAGISGLSLAQQIQSQFTYQLFEKSAAPGGRMASRRVANQRFDHGAQFFTARSPQFKQFIAGLRDEGSVADWQAHFVEMDGNVIHASRQWDDEYPHYVGVPDMAEIGRAMARQQPVRFNTDIVELKREQNRWSLRDREGQSHGPFDWVALTLPAPQTLALLPETFSGYKAIADTKMKACYALMLSLKADPGLPFQAALVKNTGISWVSVNSSKPGRHGHSLLIHASNDWAEKHLDENIDWVEKHMVDTVVAVTGLDPQLIDAAEVKRWVYANLPKQTSPPFYLDPALQIAACGDWCIKGRVEAAFNSGYKLGQKLNSL